jgi:hypothetical protein
VAEGLISTDFRSKQNLIVAHVWMVHKRLIQEGEEGKKLQEELFDQLWQDTMHRIRGMGVPEMSVNKHLKNVQHMSFGLCVSLDQAVKDQTNEHDVIEEIAGCMWRYPYQRREDVDEDRVVALAKYVRTEQLSLQQLPAPALLEGRFAWGSLPKFPPIPKDYKPIENVQPFENEAEEAAQTTAEKGEWRTAISATGKIYYWNTVTRESRWEKPKN